MDHRVVVAVVVVAAAAAAVAVAVVVVVVVVVVSYGYTSRLYTERQKKRNMTFLIFAPMHALKKGWNIPRGIASNGEVSYAVTNLDSALTMLMAMYMYGEEAVKDTKQIALGNTTGGVEHL
ncbi:hypothetical protein ElyMa_001560700 [Elysia marginata]|uniref:Uncharacterized protein n=1 Tax=Elysia marginata TaxID=1093978 RepID=A0AAV4JCU0_9GAST|nr:hypothetical protein ElyMa_001560700 [Elysia marginata]